MWTGHLLHPPHPPLSNVSGVCSSFFLITRCQLQTVMSEEPDGRHQWPVSAFLSSPGGRYVERHHGWYFCLMKPLLSTHAHCTYPCWQKGHVSEGAALAMRAVTDGVELRADASFGINQTKQCDRCLSTCYKHTARPRRLFTSLQPAYPCLHSGCGSNIRSSATDLLYWLVRWVMTPDGLGG